MTESLSRRRFLAGLAAAGLAGSGLLGGCAASRPRGPSGAPSLVLADVHVHPVLDDWIAHSALGQKAPPLARLARGAFNPTRTTWEGAWRAGVDVLVVAHYNPFDELASMPVDPDPRAPGNLLEMMDRLEEMLAEPGIARYARLVRNRHELAAAVAVSKEDPGWRVAVVHGVEGGHSLGGSLGIIPTLARRGVACFGLGHFFFKGVAGAPNALPFFPDARASGDPVGLTPFGADLVRELERWGILVDVTHATNRAVEEVLRLATRPLLASHVGSRSLGLHAYNLPDELVQEIARGDGLIAAPIYPYMLSNYADVVHARTHGGVEDVARTLRHWATVLGEVPDLPGNRAPHRFLGIGTDFGGYIPRPADFARTEDVALLRRAVRRRFADHPDPDAVAGDILAGNAIRFLATHWNSGGGS